MRLRDGKRVVFGRDPRPAPHVAAAVEASSAIPGFFAPVEIGSERYVDGGAHSPTNADLLAGAGCDVVVVVSPMSMGGSVPVTTARASRWWWHRQLARELARIRQSGARVLVFEPTLDDLQAMGHTMDALDGTRMPAVVEQATRSAAATLAGEAPLPEPGVRP
jgi:NTE family protein